MKNIKKISALVLALVMVLAMSVTAFADGEATLTGGEIGGYTEADKQNLDNKAIKIAKEITAFNPDETLIYGPAFTYTYTVTPGTSGVSITDATTDHASGLATSTTTLSGITTGVVVNGGAAGNAASAAGTLAWTNADILAADTVANGGAANTKYFTIDFTNVVFTAPGVYRYTITETPAANDASYAAAGITETTGSRVRYLDVYVMRSSTFEDLETNGGTAGKTAYVNTDWKVYGYVCVYDDNDAITPDGDTTTTGAMKTNGFVAGTNDSTAVPADQYHTYNLTIGKTLSGDNTMNSHKFPFDATWTAGTATGSFRFAVESSSAQVTTTSQAATTTVNGVTVNAGDLLYTYDTTNTAEYALTSADKDGAPSIANGGTIKYIGIPNGTKVTVTERNDVVGTTYTTTAKETIGSGTATDVVFNSSSTAALSSDGKIATTDQGDTAVYAQGTPTADSNYAVQFTNTLAIISPTGVAFRVAPYVLMLCAGIALVLITRRRENTEEA